MLSETSSSQWMPFWSDFWVVGAQDVRRLNRLRDVLRQRLRARLAETSAAPAFKWQGSPLIKAYTFIQNKDP